MGTIATLGSADFVVHFTSDYDEDPYDDGRGAGFGGTFEVNRKGWKKLHENSENLNLTSFESHDTLLAKAGRSRTEHKLETKTKERKK